LSPPPPSSLAAIKLANPGSPGKMAIKSGTEMLMFFGALTLLDRKGFRPVTNFAPGIAESSFLETFRRLT